MARRKLILFILIAVLLYIVIISFTRKNGKFCGGIAANLPEFQCPTGYICKLEGDYPDAGGSCIFILDIFSRLF